MLLISNTQDADADASAGKRRRPKKQIWDWSELVSLCEARHRIPCTTPAAAKTLELALACLGANRFAHIDERVVATWGRESIDLVYAETPRGSGLDSTSLNRWVKVFPAHGGLTSYCIDSSCNGHFCNKHLPINAAQRQTRSGYRNSQWYHGRSGVYQPGCGPYYPDAGAAFANHSAEEFCGLVAACDAVPQKFRDAATSFVERAVKELSPFPSAVLRYEMYGLGSHDHLRMVIHAQDEVQRKGGIPWLSVPSEYGIRVRIKSPMTKHNREWIESPDMSICCTGPLQLMQFSPDVCYAWELLSPHGSHSIQPVRSKNGEGAGLPEHGIFVKPAPLLDLAKLWACNAVQIPVED